MLVSGVWKESGENGPKVILVPGEGNFTEMVMGLCFWLSILEISGLEWFYANDQWKGAFLVALVGLRLAITRNQGKNQRKRARGGLCWCQCPSPPSGYGGGWCPDDHLAVCRSSCKSVYGGGQSPRCLLIVLNTFFSGLNLVEAFLWPPMSHFVACVAKGGYPLSVSLSSKRPCIFPQKLLWVSAWCST